MKTMELFNLKGKTAIVTGGATGLGQQVVLGLAEAGADIVICSRKLERCQEMACQIESLGRKALALRCDIINTEEVDQVVKESLKKFGRIDILVNNAGTTWAQNAEDFEVEKWKEVINANITGTFLCSQRIGREMIRQKSGKIINISSFTGYVGCMPELMNALPYNTSKGAIIAFTKDLAMKWIRYNINVNAIAPGWFITRMTGKHLESVGKEWLPLIPRGRFGEEDDLKGAIVFLASKASDYVVGQVLVVDGGILSM